MRRKWVTTTIQYAIGLALLAFVVARNWEAPEGSDGVGLRVALFEREHQWGFALPALACLAFAILLTFVRWYMLVRAQDLPFRLRDAIRLGLVGHFFNTFLPGSVGGDLLKAAFIVREQQRRTVAVSTVLIDRGIGLWALIGIAALVGGVFWLAGDPLVAEQPELKQGIRVALGLMAATLTVWGLLGLLPERRARRFAQRLHSIPRLGVALAEFWRAVWLYRQRGGSVLRAFLLAMFGHVFVVLSFYFAALTFQPMDLMPGLMPHFVIVPAGMGIQGFVPTPGGLGGGEAIFGWSYAVLGFPKVGGILGSLGVRLSSWVVGFVGYTIYQFMKNDLQRVLPGGDDHTSTNSSSPESVSSTTTEG